MTRTSRRLFGLTIAFLPALPLRANPALPAIPAATFTVPAATGNAAQDTANIQAAIDLANSSGGGKVVVSNGTYLSNLLTLRNNINLELGAGVVIQNANPAATLITMPSGTHDVEISGSGMIDGHATATSSANLVSLRGGDKIFIHDVTIANPSHFHLVVQEDSNVTIDHININDNFSVSSTGNYLGNTDGIDFSGSHFLIQNSSINSGDDNIVAKPQNTFCSDIVIAHNTLGHGHGISVGGQTNKGLDGMEVYDNAFNGTDNGLRLKAGKGQGGIVKNVSYHDITMTNVKFPVIINSWYDGGDHYGSSEVSASQLHDPTKFNESNPGDPPIIVDQDNNGTDLYPFYYNISYANITATGATQDLIIYGLNSNPADPSDPLRNINNINFSNVSLSGTRGADIYYTSQLGITGLSITRTTGNAFNLSGNSVPEPGAILPLVIAAVAFHPRKRADRALRCA